MGEKTRNEAEISLLKDMEATAARMRELIVGMPPIDLLGYIYAQPILIPTVDQSVTIKGPTEALDPKVLESQSQFLLEYVHAVLASDVAPEDLTFNETKCAELFELSRHLREQALKFARVSSEGTKTGIFGPDTAEIEYRAKSSWVVLRGRRHHALEEEFFRYVLAPHDDVLNEVYGVGADDIAEGIQAIANATRFGREDAISEMKKQFPEARAFADANQISLEYVTRAWGAKNSEQRKAVGRAYDYLFRAGIAKVSRHTKLPPLLLADLAYSRGEETEFFDANDFAGTPYRTLPARKKPLIQLESDYYAADPCSIRDAGYRTLLHYLLERKSDYKDTLNDRQKLMSESAFAEILSAQLPNAQVFQGFYIKTGSDQPPEHDMLILIDDVLILVEAKAGAIATIASPERDFDRHARSVDDLVVKAHEQCDRFFRYLNSADEVSIYQRTEGNYEECGRIRRSDYRVMVPIGLTVESYAPIAAFCKELPEIEPLLGKHAFISLSIDDLFVLKRFLPTPGSFAHYLEVRQSFAGMRRAHLFDEFDHLGAYLAKNRFDYYFANQFKSSNAKNVIGDGASEVVHKYFAGEDWKTKAPPTQYFPDEVLKLLDALDAKRATGWLSAESHIRDIGFEHRRSLDKLLIENRETLSEHPFRYFPFVDPGGPLFVWLQQHNHQVDWTKVSSKASALAVASNADKVIGIFAEVSADGVYHQAHSFAVQIPTVRTRENAHIYEDAARMVQLAKTLKSNQSRNTAQPVRTIRPGRNELCPCGSGVKYKRCHGR